MWVPYSTAMQKITGERYIQMIMAKIAANIASKQAEAKITEVLSRRHGLVDFNLYSSDSIRKTIESTTNTMTLLISGVAIISLIVGGIGVMNIMLVSVTERTKEIGIRMAIGARRGNILQQFLIEAVLICVIGGLTGIALSYAISLAFNHIVTDFAMTFSKESIIAAVLCASMIGVIFGFMPAQNASKLNPIEALSRD